MTPVPPSPAGADPVVGIDLGTTNSLVALADASGPRILEGPAGGRIVPSVVRYDERGRPIAIGDEAREHAVEHPESTISSVKRLMGRSLADAEADAPFLSYSLVEGEGDTARVRLPEGGVVSAQEVSAVILGELKRRASEALGTEVRRAVVTVPAYFDDAQRQATRDAGRLAGLEIVRIVNEPTAAALAYGLGLGEKTPETVAVFDLGGGTFDISILSVIPASEHPGASTDFFQVLSTAGDTHLGGDDADRAILDLVVGELADSLGKTPRLTANQRQALRLLAERTKITLSEREEASIDLSFAGVEYERTLTRAEFEALIDPWVERALDACRRALRDAKLGASDIDRVVMVGGSTRIPLVRRRVAELFESEPYTALNPDEVVALGAAVQGAIMAGLKTDALLLDVIPLSLGIETVGGAVAKLVVRNSTLPARATEMFSTSVDGQTSIKLHVLQGEREMVADCRSLGTFHLRGIPPMPAGIPQLEVEFLVDASGVLSVSAVEKRSGKRAALQIVPNHGLSAEEVDRIEAESFAHAREDMQRHRVVDLIANGRLDLKWIGERLEKIAGDLDPGYRAEVETSAGVLRSLIEQAEADWSSVEPERLHSAKEDLDRVSVRMHEISIAKSLREDAARADAGS